MSFPNCWFLWSLTRNLPRRTSALCSFPSTPSSRCRILERGKSRCIRELWVHPNYDSTHKTFCLGEFEMNAAWKTKPADVQTFQQLGADVSVRNWSQPLSVLGSTFLEQPVRVCLLSWPACREWACLLKPGADWNPVKSLTDCGNAQGHSCQRTLYFLRDCSQPCFTFLAQLTGHNRKLRSVCWTVRTGVEIITTHMLGGVYYFSTQASSLLYWDVLSLNKLFPVLTFI